MMYLINFAIASCFVEILIDELKSCDYSTSFDESLNEITQTCHIMFMVVIEMNLKIKYVCVT